jgi:mRNA interferase MazF
MTTTAYDSFDIVEVPFPFSDLPKAKLRKALVLTPKAMNEANGATTLMMITSRKNSTWVGDRELVKWHEAGLKKPCFARLKFFTPDNKLVVRKVGELAPEDRSSVTKTLRGLIAERDA